MTAAVAKAKPKAKSKGLEVPILKKSDATRQRVLDVTSDLFRRNGYQATSMRDIAAAVGMKSGSLYYYYDSKEALLAAILNDTIDAHLAILKEAVDNLPANSTVRQKLDKAFQASVKIISDSGDMAVASAQTLSFLQEPEYSEQVRHRQAYNQFWRDLIEEGKRTGEIRKDLPDAVASMAIVGALTFVAEWFESDRSTTDEVGALFSSLFIDGMRA
ncbi:AcrR family transcriptional regulator [Sphingobium xenophagum]|uniref:AcrR family transcriptional regulator n=1 Tax=Sphingobium xenophagum TaxID=121428 RepID=A0ABU1X4F9_SPHXE|nr:TetR/AcrR family transcriptional regulator [Sphingobium xenophagum]MDR7156483.1 AcrR family transcriptional regulator [Sphingobium xenophagum]